MKGRVESSRANLIKSQHNTGSLKRSWGFSRNRPTAIQPIRSATNLTQLAGLPPDPSTTPYLISSTIATKTHHFIQYKNIVQCIYIYCSRLLQHFPLKMACFTVPAPQVLSPSYNRTTTTD